MLSAYRFYRNAERPWPRRLALLMQIGGRWAVDRAIKRRYPVPRVRHAA